MTLRTRRRIFYALFALFIVVGGSVAFYADGWRLDLTTWHLEKVGGIYIRAFPEDAAISLNGKPIVNQSGFLTAGTLISNLLPHTYRVELTSPGFDVWHENAAVLPSLVTQFKTAVLVPADSIPGSSSTLEKWIAGQPTSTVIDPFDATQQLMLGKNKISLFDNAQATTTLTINIHGRDATVEWITSDIIGILKPDGTFSLYHTDTQTLTNIANGVKAFAATSDGSLVATLEPKSLEVFPLDSSNNYYRFNVPDLGGAEKLIWYKDQNHLFIVYPNSLVFLDLADVNLTNLTVIGQGTKPVYDPQTNALYLTNVSGKLVEYDFPK